MRSFLLAAVAVWAAVSVSAQPISPGLTGADLVDALVAGYKPSAVLTLDQSKDTLYAVVDTAHVGGQVGAVGMYSGHFVALDCDPTCDPSQDIHNGGAGLNQEHVWPRSRGAACASLAEPVATCDNRAESDLHHLRAARSSVNSARGNLPFGVSPDAQTSAWYRGEVATSEAPPADRDAWSERLSDTLFEPRRSEKGDVARAALYAFTMYGPRATGQADPAFFETMRAALLDWNDADPPDARETARMWRAARYQQDKPNPFVLDPSLARRAYGDGSGPARARSAYAPVAWVNEIHYDDAGTDDGEFVEVAVDAAFPDPAELVMTLYNGASGTPYQSVSLSTFAPGQTLGAARLATWTASGIQNGDPDGIALSYSGGAGAVLVEFVCYGGTMTASGGPADGVACADIGVAESNRTAEGTSLQRVGTGTDGRTLGWTAGVASSPGHPNAGQTIRAPQHALTLDGLEGWRLISAPSATTAADLLGPLWTQGAVGSDDPSGPATVLTWVPGDGWAAVGDLGQPLEPGQGLSVYVFDDDDPAAEGVQGGFPKTLGSSGYAAEAPFRFALNPPAGGPRGGLTLVGNPSAAPLAWGDHWDHADVSATAYVYDPALPGYRLHNGTDGSLPGGAIPPFAAFWVESGGPAPRLMAPVVVALPARRSVESLQLVARARLGGTVRTALATVSVDPDARADRDPLDGVALDALADDYVSLATVADGARLALDARPLVAGDTVWVEVGAVRDGAPAAAEVTVSWPHVPASVSLWWTDGGAETRLVAGGEQTVSVGPGSPGRWAVIARGRSVASEPAAAPAALAVRLGPNPTAGPAHLWAQAPGAQISAEVFDPLGRRVGRLETRLDRLDAALPTAALAAGVYAVRIRAEHADGRITDAVRQLVVVR